MVAYGGSASTEEIAAGGFEANMTREERVSTATERVKMSRMERAPTHVDG